jgi:hypothetical protein
MMETTVTANATPRPVYRFLNVALGIGIVVLILTAITLFFTYRGSATGAELDAQGQRRDCVTTIQNARRAVYDGVDIDKAILIKGAADRQFGLPLDGDPAYFQSVDQRLGRSLVEAKRLRPAKTLNQLIARGGMIDGVHYDSCPE